MRTFSCVVPATIILCADIPGLKLPFTRSALKSLAHAMVYDAIRSTEEERGFFAGGVEDAHDQMSASRLMPKGYGNLDNLTTRIAKGHRPCPTTAPTR